jgi:Zn-dependent protease with chaperone function
VNKTYFAIAIWWAFVAVALVPFAIALLFQYSAFSFSQTWHILVLTVFVYLTLNGILRAREVYADVRASTWESSPKALIRVLQSLRPPHGRWQALASLHPDPDERCQMVHETHRLFRVDLWITFSLGIAISHKEG